MAAKQINVHEEFLFFLLYALIMGPRLKAWSWCRENAGCQGTQAFGSRLPVHLKRESGRNLSKTHSVWRLWHTDIVPGITLIFRHHRLRGGWRAYRLLESSSQHQSSTDVPGASIQGHNHQKDFPDATNDIKIRWWFTHVFRVLRYSIGAINRSMVRLGLNFRK